MQISERSLAPLREALLHSAVGTVIAILFIATGIACLVIYRMRKRNADAALLWFGVFLILYGVRDADFLRVVSIIGHFDTPQFWGYFSAVISHVIAIPFLLFLRKIFANWDRALRWILWAEVCLAIINITADAVLHRPDVFSTSNSAIVLA